MTDHLDMWAAHSPLAGHALDQVTVDFLLPTGIYIQMDVPREATIQHIKLVSSGGLSVVVPSCCQWGEKAQTASSTHNHAACQTLSNACFDRGWLLWPGGSILFGSTSRSGLTNR